MGHIVTANTVKPDQKKVKALVGAQALKDKKALKSFCAAASYLRSYIPNFAKTIEPLTRLSSQYVKFRWDEAQQHAFEKIRNDMVNATYLMMLSWSKPFIIFADATEVAVGAVLTQVAEDQEQFNFIIFASKKFSDQ